MLDYKKTIVNTPSQNAWLHRRHLGDWAGQPEVPIDGFHTQIIRGFLANFLTKTGSNLRRNRQKFRTKLTLTDECLERHLGNCLSNTPTTTKVSHPQSRAANYEQTSLFWGGFPRVLGNLNAVGPLTEPSRSEFNLSNAWPFYYNFIMHNYLITNLFMNNTWIYLMCPSICSRLPIWVFSEVIINQFLTN